MASPSSLFGLFDPNRSYDHTTETSESAISEAFGDYLIFLVLSIIFNMMIRLFTRVKGHFSRQLCDSKTPSSQSPREYSQSAAAYKSENFESVSEPRRVHKEYLITKLIKAGLCYTLAFCFFEIILFCAFTIYASEKIDSTNLHPLGQLRTLEEVNPTVPAVKKPEKISIAMGRVLASFDVEPTELVLSQDEKWAYVSTQNPQLIRVYDTSNFKAPVQVATVNLGETARPKMFLELSTDGTILAASNYEDVIIINVTVPESPQIAGSFNSPMYKSSDNTISVSMAISKDNQYLFMAEVGFAVLDISNPANIALVYSSVKRAATGTGTFSFFAASSDRKWLYLTAGTKTLEVYNMENPSNPQVALNVPLAEAATSVYLSKDEKRAYVVGIFSLKKILVTILDISNPIKTKEVNKFQVVGTKTTIPIIQALSPQETKLYLTQQQSLMIIDLTTRSIENNNESLVKNTLVSFAFCSDGKYAGVAYLEQIVFIEFFTDFPNSRIFTSSNTTTASFVVQNRFESWALNNEGNYLFLASNDYELKKTFFEVWNIISPRKFISFNAAYFGVSLTAPLLSFRMSADNKRGYLKWWTKEISKLQIIDLSGNLKAPKKLKEYDVPMSLNFEDFIFSSDEKILCIASDPNTIRLYDEEGLLKSEIKITSDLLTASFDLAFAKSDTVLLVITSKVWIYNIQDLTNPVLLGSISLTEGGSPRILSVVVLEEENSLIIEWYQTARRLRIYNISEIASPKLTSEFLLPKRIFSDAQDLRSEYYGPFAYAKNQKMGYVGTNGKLLKLNLSDLKNPVIESTVPVVTCEGCNGTSRFLISPDGNTALSANQAGTLKSLKLNGESLDLYKGSDVNSQVFIIDLQIRFTLYLPQEKFLLGEKYSDSILTLKSDGKQAYQVSTKAQAKVLKLYSYEISVVSSKTTPEVKPFSLPDWIKFDPETLQLVVEPKSKKDLGTYTICAAISDEVKKANLGKIDLGGILDIPVDQILGMLVSLGYMDRQYHLTNGLGSREDFFFPDQMLGIGRLIDKNKIYDFLTKFYVEACTKIEIVPSLKVSQTEKKILIDTPNTEAVKIDITLVGQDKMNPSAQFLQKTYGPLVPSVRDQKIKIILEGTLDEVHTALQNVVINAPNGRVYDGIMTIHDGINDPIVNRKMPRISECFLRNSPPFENPNTIKTFQEQIDRMPVVTGQYFAIIWDENTFKDKHAETLHYEVVYDNDENTGKPKVMPDWLSFSNLALRGTPPEKLTDREIPLKFIVKNEFQNITIPFKLNIGISPTFVLSLLIKYSPMLLTMIGFYIQANKIYNIVGKQRYKHSKEYHVEAGQEISSEVILPILFIEEELGESQLIMNHLLKSLKMKSLNELACHFVDQEGKLDKSKLRECVLETTLNLALKEKKRLKLYLDGSDSNRKKILQLIINRISILRIELPEEKNTKRVFESIKDQFADFVEWDSESLFVVNQEKLTELVEKKNSLNPAKEEEEEEDRRSLVQQEINQELLQDAIISHAFARQSINARSSMVILEMHERFERHWVKKFLKQDLEGAHLNNKLGVDYGIDCKMVDDVLIFSGIVRENFIGRTLAIQIQSIQLRILKEIWIYEKQGTVEKRRSSTAIELSSSRTETSLRGKEYEIY